MLISATVPSWAHHRVCYARIYSLECTRSRCGSHAQSFRRGLGSGQSRKRHVKNTFLHADARSKSGGVAEPDKDLCVCVFARLWSGRGLQMGKDKTDACPPKGELIPTAAAAAVYAMPALRRIISTDHL